MKDLDLIVLNMDIPEFKLKKGDMGTVVLTHADGKAFEVEFATLGGDTLAVVTLESDQVRPVNDREIAHAQLVETSR